MYDGTPVSVSLDSVEPELAPLVGTELNGIRILKPIGVGGMGVVFEGHQDELNRKVAVKVANPSLGAEKSSRFLREAKAAAGLDHPNCITVYEFGTHGDVQYMVMPLLRGRPLSALLNKAISIERAVQMGLQILLGLEHAHSRRVIHRDLKPENIFVIDRGDQEVLKIVDFGIAKILDAEHMEGTATMSGLMSGTPEYMSPEQALGLPTDPRSDIYSAGIILYRLLSGSLPFTDDDPIVQLRRHITDEVPPLPSNVPAPVARVVARMVRKERDERYQTATDALADLKAIRDGAHLLPGDRLPGPPDFDSLTDATLADEYDERMHGTSRRSKLPTAAQRAVGSETMVSAAEDEAEVFLESPASSRKPMFYALVVAASVVVAVAAAFAYGGGGDETQLAKASVLPETPAKATQPAPADDEMLRKLAAVNETNAAAQLPYVPRHALLDELNADPRTRALIDRRLNLGLDLRQAAQSPTPCTSYREARRALTAIGPEALRTAIEGVTPPAPSSVPGAGIAPDGSCEGLGQAAAKEAGTPLASAPPMQAKNRSSDARRALKRNGRSSDRSRSEPAPIPAPTLRVESKAGANPSAAPWERKSGAGELKNPYE